MRLGKSRVRSERGVKNNTSVEKGRTPRNIPFCYTIPGKSVHALHWGTSSGRLLSALILEIESFNKIM